jgi:hypothetical protein
VMQAGRSFTEQAVMHAVLGFFTQRFVHERKERSPRSSRIC